VASEKQRIWPGILTAIQKEIDKTKRVSLDWSELIKRIYEIDPLTCTKCSQKIKIVRFVTHQAYHTED
jgi:hypothetical protein